MDKHRNLHNCIACSLGAPSTKLKVVSLAQYIAASKGATKMALITDKEKKAKPFSNDVHSFGPVGAFKKLVAINTGESNIGKPWNHFAD